MIRLDPGTLQGTAEPLKHSLLSLNERAKWVQVFMKIVDLVWA